MDRKMIKATFCLLLVTLLTIIYSGAFAQQNQNTQEPGSEIETLKIQLQTVENEKIELTAELLDAQAKLADANAKLINTEFGKLERELRDSNNKWLWGWTAFFVGILAVIGIAFWFFVKSLIADSVERSLSGFKEAVKQVNILKDELKVLQKEHTASVLENFIFLHSDSEYPYPEKINVLSETALVDVFSDKTRPLRLRHKAAEILAHRRSTLLVGPALGFLNLIVDSDLYTETSFETKYLLRDFVSFIGYTETLEAYRGLKEFLHRLLTENLKHKNLFLTDTVFSIVWVSTKLNAKDSVSTLKTAIAHLDVKQVEHGDLESLAAYFDMFNETAGIKEILTKHITTEIPGVEDKCLELLEKHDPDFVREWKAQKADANTQNKEPS